MRLPNKFKLASHEMDVVRTNDLMGCTDFDRRKLTITNRPGYEAHILIHELLESILLMENLTYDPRLNEQEFLVVMNHTELDRVARVLAETLVNNNINFTKDERGSKRKFRFCTTEETGSHKGASE